MQIHDILGNIYSMPEDSVQKLVAKMKKLSFVKGDRILQAGKVERNIFFVEKGIVRAYLPLDGKDITFWIGMEGAAVVSLKSYVCNEPGYETVECVEDTVVYVLQREVLDELFGQDIYIANWGRRFAENEFLQAEEKFLPLLFTNATQRYEMLLKRQPYLLQCIPLEHLASYLGITPVSLSRIRAVVAGKR